MTIQSDRYALQDCEGNLVFGGAKKVAAGNFPVVQPKDWRPSTSSRRRWKSPWSRYRNAGVAQESLDTMQFASPAMPMLLDASKCLQGDAQVRFQSFHPLH